MQINIQLLAEARHRVTQEMARDTADQSDARQALEVRSYVLTLREGELDRRAREQEASVAQLRDQVQALTTMLRLEQAGREFERQRAAELLATLNRAQRGSRNRRAALSPHAAPSPESPSAGPSRQRTRAPRTVRIAKASTRARGSGAAKRPTRKVRTKKR